MKLADRMRCLVEDLEDIVSDVEECDEESIAQMNLKLKHMMRELQAANQVIEELRLELSIARGELYAAEQKSVC